MEEFEERWKKIQEQKDEEAKIKLAQLEEEFPLQDRILAISEMKAKERLAKELQELEEYELRSKNSIPPRETLELDVAETNYSPKIYDWQELINSHDENKEGTWLIKDILRPGWLAVVGGHGKQGKSTLVLHILNYLRLGKPFVNESKAVPIIYLNFEMGRQDTAGLVKAVTSGIANDGESAKFVDEISAPLSLEWLTKFLTEQEKPGICVIDSFRGAFLLSGDTENQAGTVGNILRKLQYIARRSGWTIIIIHHFRKSGKGDPLDLAGSGEWLSAPDVILTWSCTNFKEPGVLIMRGRIPPCDPLSIRLSRDSIEFMGTVAEHEAEAEKEKILEILTSEWAESNDIAKTTDLPGGTTRRRLNQLYEDREIERMGQGKRGDPYLWRKASEPEKDIND